MDDVAFVTHFGIPHVTSSSVNKRLVNVADTSCKTDKAVCHIKSMV